MAFLVEEIEKLPAGWEAKYLDCQSEQYSYSLEFSKCGLTVNALIPEKYPEDHAVIDMGGNDWKDVHEDMQRRVMQSVHELAKVYGGQPMLGVLLEEAWNMTRSEPLVTPVIQKHAVKPTQHTKKQKKKTELSRDLPPPTKTSVNISKDKQHNDSETKKNSNRKKGQKLPSMKTAKDVINRLKWDEQLKNENFIVGYEDRFQGIIEVPVWCLNWEDDIAATGPDDKLAIPEHRIQHFKWNSEIVWERITRTDYMFGSTEKGCDIVEFIKRYQAQTVKKSQQCHEPCHDEQENADVGRKSPCRIENQNTSSTSGNGDYFVNSTHSSNSNSVDAHSGSKGEGDHFALEEQTVEGDSKSTSVHCDSILISLSESHVD